MKSYAKAGIRPAARLSLWRVSIPVFFETALNLSLYISDAFFLSRVSDLSAGAIGSLFPVLGLFVFGYQAFSQSGTSVAAQFLSMGNILKSITVFQIMICIAVIVGALVSTIVYMSAGHVGRLLGFERLASSYVNTYLLIVGPFLFLQFARITYGTILSFQGRTQWPMLGSFITSVANICLNAWFLFGDVDLNLDRVGRVALATVISQLAGLLLLMFIVHNDRAINDVKSLICHNQSQLFKSIFAVAAPSCIEPISTNFLFIAQLMIIAHIGQNAIIAHNYVFNVTMVVVIFSTSLAIGTQIVISHMIGRRELEEVTIYVCRNCRIVYVVVLLSGLAIYLFSDPILRILTKDDHIVELAQSLMLLSMPLQLGVATNLIVGMALRTTKDSRYCAVMGVAVMWLIGLPSMFFLGVTLGAGVLGVWVGKLIDEGVRGVLHYRRWIRRIWAARVVELR